LEVLRQELFAPGSAGALLWDNSSVSRLLALIETPEAMEVYVLRAQGQDDAWPQASAKQ
jgi:hypothetical protein